MMDKKGLFYDSRTFTQILQRCIMKRFVDIITDLMGYDGQERIILR
jgi:hypothetical protein